VSNERKYILSKEIAGKKLRRMALEVVERNYDEPQLVLIGIKENGIVIADKLANHLKTIFKGGVIVTALTINKKNPGEVIIEPAIDFNNKVVVLIDDVANSGRTMLYSLQPLLKTYPKKIQTAALVERTHKSYPIALDYVGLSISTNLDEHIFVEVKKDEVEGAWMEVIS
jgi:pyrimidine operon attenuation protein / uracil phosphoribosyltransferase